MGWVWNIVGKRRKNIVGKRRKCWLPAFSPFPTMFSKGFIFKVVESPNPPRHRKPSLYGRVHCKIHCMCGTFTVHFTYMCTCIKLSHLSDYFSAYFLQISFGLYKPLPVHFGLCQTDSILQTKNILTLYSIDTHFNASTTDSFWKHCGKRRNCSWRAISSFPTMFLLSQKIVSLFVHIFDIISLFTEELEEHKICMWGKGLILLFGKHLGKTAWNQHFLKPAYSPFCSMISKDFLSRDV